MTTQIVTATAKSMKIVPAYHEENPTTSHRDGKLLETGHLHHHHLHHQRSCVALPCFHLSLVCFAVFWFSSLSLSSSSSLESILSSSFVAILDQGPSIAVASGKRHLWKCAATMARKLALLEELKESIQRMERESAPMFVDASPSHWEPECPAQLSERQEVPTPPDGLCLSHACIAAGDAKRWLAEHGEQGFRHPGDRTQ